MSHLLPHFSQPEDAGRLTHTTSGLIVNSAVSSASHSPGPEYAYDVTMRSYIPMVARPSIPATFPGSCRWLSELLKAGLIKLFISLHPIESGSVVLPARTIGFIFTSGKWDVTIDAFTQLFIPGGCTSPSSTGRRATTPAIPVTDNPYLLPGFVTACVEKGDLWEVEDTYPYLTCQKNKISPVGFIQAGHYAAFDGPVCSGYFCPTVNLFVPGESVSSPGTLVRSTILEPTVPSTEFTRTSCTVPTSACLSIDLAPTPLDPGSPGPGVVIVFIPVAQDSIDILGRLLSAREEYGSTSGPDISACLRGTIHVSYAPLGTSGGITLRPEPLAQFPPHVGVVRRPCTADPPSSGARRSTSTARR